MCNVLLGNQLDTAFSMCVQPCVLHTSQPYVYSIAYTCHVYSVPNSAPQTVIHTTALLVAQYAK